MTEDELVWVQEQLRAERESAFEAGWNAFRNATLAHSREGYRKRRPAKPKRDLNDGRPICCGVPVTSSGEQWKCLSCKRTSMKKYKRGPQRRSNPFRQDSPVIPG